MSYYVLTPYSAEFIQVFRASSLSPQVVLPCPDCLLSREMPSKVISAMNKEVKEVMASLIAALTANGSYAFPFLCWQASISSCSGNHHSYICGISSHTNETKSPGLSIMHSLPLYNKVALH